MLERLSEKIRNGQQLTESELMFGRSVGGSVFAPAMEKLDIGRGADSEARIARNLGLTERGDVAARRLAEVNQNVNLSVNVAGMDLAQQFQNAVMPEFQRAIDQLNAQVAAALANVELNTNSQRMALNFD